MLRTVARAARLAQQHQLLSRQVVHVRPIAAMAASSSSLQPSLGGIGGSSNTSHSRDLSMAYAAAAAIASLALVGSNTTTTRVECETKHNDVGGFNRLPSNGSQSRPSITGPTLEKTYMVDFDSVLGQGSYGSVHPAIIKETGELVSNMMCDGYLAADDSVGHSHITLALSKH